MKLKNLIFKLLIIFFSLFFLIIFFEFALRIMGLGNPLLYKTNLSYRYYPKPNQNIERFGNKIIINNLALRSNDDWLEKDNDKTKIIFFGDSVTYGGSFLNNDNLFSSLVCAELNLKNNSYKCGNAGVNGYGSDNINNRIIYGDLDSDIYIITLIGDSSFRSLVNIGSTPSHSELPKYLPALKEFTYWILWRVMMNLRQNDWWFKGNIDQNYNIAKLSLNNLKNTLNNIVKNEKKKVFVILHPNKDQLSPIDNLNRKILLIKYDLLKDEFMKKENYFEVINLEEEIKKLNSSNIYYDDVHLSKDGHKFFSEQILKLIKQKP